MKEFYITSTITIMAKDREAVDNMLKDDSNGEIGADLFDNAQVDEGQKVEYEQGDCQSCGEPLNNGEGELCASCYAGKLGI